MSWVWRRLEPWLGLPWWGWGLALASALGMFLAFPDGDVGWLAWVALMPLGLLCHWLDGRRCFVAAWLAGTVFSTFSLSWLVTTMTVFGSLPAGLSWLLITLLGGYMGLYWGFWAGLLVLVRERWGLAMWAVGPLVWVLGELLRAWVWALGGFPWLSLGYTQWQLPVARDVVAIVGVYGLSGLIVAWNLMLAEGLVDVRRTGAWQRLAGFVAVGALVTGGLGMLGRGLSFEPGERCGETISVALVQGNIPQEMKWDSRHRSFIIDRYFDITREAAADGIELVIWPEAATPFRLRTHQYYGHAVRRLADDLNIALITGSTDRNGDDSFNAVFMVDEGGRFVELHGVMPDESDPGAAIRYIKTHLVPFGEYVPFEELFFFVEPMVYSPADFGHGIHFRPFVWSDSSWGANVCYEIIFPDIIRKHVANGADAIVNVTNEAWFGRSPATRQMLAMSVIRAVENNRPVLRCANTGISAVIDSRGEVLSRSNLEEVAVLYADVPVGGCTAGVTVFTRVGNVGAIGLMVLLLGVGLMLRRRNGLS